MAVDLFANAANTTLAAGIAAGATSLTVTSSTLFPAVTTAAATQFRVVIDNELFIVTNVSGTTWTVTPGTEGTTQAAHSINAPVTALLTAAALATKVTSVQAAAAAPVQTVAGRTGAVVLAYADVTGLGTAAVEPKVAAGSAGVLNAVDASTTNSRVPTAHAASHAAAGTDPVGSVPLSVAGQIPQPAGTAAIGSISAAARTDHVHPVAGLIEWFGDALDGDLVFNGAGVTLVATTPSDFSAGTLTATSNVYTLPRDLYCRNLTVAATYTLNTAGYRIFATGTATINGAISHNGRNAVGSAGGAATMGGGIGVPLAAGGAGQNGGTGTGSQGQSPQYFPSSYGNGAGGSGGAGAGGAINTGGTPPYASTVMRSASHQALSAFFGMMTYFNSSNIYSGGTNTVVQAIEGGRGGSSGAGDATNSGGGGGGAAGVCIVNARYLTGSGSIAANGGNGGAATVGNCGGGGGASGGVCFVNTADAAGTVSGLPAWTGTVTANGGTGGAGFGTGTAGSTANAGLAFLTTWK